MRYYLTQAWNTTQSEWRPVRAKSMAHAAAIVAAADSPKGGHVIVHVVDPDVPSYQNAPRVVHRFELRVEFPPAAD